MVLTAKNFILRDESGKVIEEIQLTSLGNVTAGENSLREPTLTLTITAQTGETRLIELIYARQPGGLNIQERDKSFEILRDHAITVPEIPKKSEAEVTARLTAQEWMPTSYKDSAGDQAREIPGKGRSQILTIASIIIILAVIAGVGLFYHPSGTGNTPLNPVNATPVPTAILTAASPSPPPTTESPQPTITPGPVATPEVSIPSTGVWVRIQYPGNYTGSIGAQGTTIPVNSSGDHVYTLPVRDGSIEGSIEKQDSSNSRLEVGIYQDGSLVQLLNTTKPAGLVDWHITLPPSTATVGVVFTPTPAVTLPVIPLPDVPLPKKGVWVRVFYPGNFTGSIGYLGFQTPINSTGDQFYQIPITTGDIIGSIEKQDGSGNNLAVAIYKDGAIVARLDTAVPRGIIYIRSPV